MYTNSKTATATDKEIHDVVIKTLEFLTDQWPTEVTVEFKHMRSKCYCRPDKTLVFGYEFLRTAMTGAKNTDTKYYKDWFGLNAVVLTAAHEYCHAVLFDLGFYDTRDWHGQDFWHYLHQMTADILKDYKI